MALMFPLPSQLDELEGDLGRHRDEIKFVYDRRDVLVAVQPTLSGCHVIAELLRQAPGLIAAARVAHQQREHIAALDADIGKAHALACERFPMDDEFPVGSVAELVRLLIAARDAQAESVGWHVTAIREWQAENAALKARIVELEQRLANPPLEPVAWLDDDDD